MAKVNDILHEERRDQKDIYLPLRPPTVRVEVNDPLAPGPERYKLVARVDRADIALRFTETSFRQLCALTAIPTFLLGRAPAALGLNLLRSMLEMSEAGEGKPFLLRMRLTRRPILRAILPQSFVRLADIQVADALWRAADGRDVRVASLSVDEDTWFTRLLIGEEINLGSKGAPDPVMPGFDLITSETGVRPMEMRHTLLRLVCANGMTRAAEKRPTWQSRYTSVERRVLESRLAKALDRAFDSGQEMAGHLSDSRADYITDPRGEIDRIFRGFRLGNPTGRIGEWVAAEVMKTSTLFGISRWTICQAFTAVARGLDHLQRMNFEDAMGNYLMRGAEPKARKDN
jgi:hypothetical protein